VADDPTIEGREVLVDSNVLLDVLTEDAQWYGPAIRPGGVLVVNSSLDPRHRSVRTSRRCWSANQIAEEVGDIKYTGMVGLGALIEATGVVSFDAVSRCLRGTLPAYRHHTIPANEQALRRGVACMGRTAPVTG
jgi:2-oxoglutarate ferredoxin oxidoreductase subunit gamma